MPRSLQVPVERTRSVVNLPGLEADIAVRSPYMHQTGR